MNVAALVWLLGWVALAFESTAPRLIFPAVSGLAAITGAAFYLLRRAPEPAALLFLAGAACLFAVETLLRTRFLAGLGGTATLVYLFCFVIAPQQSMAAGWAVGAALVPGLILTLGAARMREGWRAKRDNL